MAGKDHPKFAECLSDYAFYLLNVDGVAASVDVYKVNFPSPIFFNKQTGFPVFHSSFCMQTDKIQIDMPYCPA